MLKTLIYRTSLCLGLLFAAWACTDDFDPSGGYIGEGSADVEMKVSFHPLVAAVANTGRAADGDALSDLNDITVFAYDQQGKIYNIYSGSDLKDLKVADKDEEGANTDMPDYAGGKPAQAEETTASATFTIEDIPYGRYSFYAVANLGTFPNDEATRTKYETAKKLQNLTVEWDQDSIAFNDQMFGFFTPDGEDEEDGFDAPLLAINQPLVNLHAWVQRCASKVTVVFDGSGLHENIWIYIKSVTVKDIPRYCKIGAFNGVYTEAGQRDSVVVVEAANVNRNTINYDTKGPISSWAKQSDDYRNWLAVSKGTGKRGAVEVSEQGDTVLHSEYGPALYFYENMQGNYPDQDKYDKRPKWDEVGKIPGPNDPGYKDNVPYGSYIEVEAYYNSQNENNVSQGRIIYRFMLGQDEKYNYNASRNHHYQVTLGFKGYANQPDWHIAYIEPPETVFSDPTYYISYMYNQRATFPIRILGKVKQVEVEIVENNWAPFDSTQVGNVPQASFGEGLMDFKWNKEVYDNAKMKDATDCNKYNSQNTLGNTANNFVNNYGYYYGLQKPYTTNGESQAFYSEKDQAKGAPKYVTPIWAGFLSLMVAPTPVDNLPAVVNETLGYQAIDGCKTLKDKFFAKDAKGNRCNYRIFNSTDLKQDVVDPGTNNECKIVHADDGSLTLHLPMWTREKSFMGISGFSGNNPYDTYQRRAIVKIKVTYENGKTITRYKPVFQVRRVVNPKAVWHKFDDVSSFHVQLTRREGAQAEEFSTFDSEGDWRAYVKTSNAGNFITLGTGPSGGSSEIHGTTDHPVDFYINFPSKAESTESRCAIVEIEYHGYTCRHSIFVRQGYNTALDVTGIPVNGKAVEWSSFALYKCEETPAFGTTWNATTKNYIKADLTVSPLALGTFFKRGNYNGILISNNLKFGVDKAPNRGYFNLADGDSLDWNKIQGYPYSDNYGGWNIKNFGTNTPQRNFAWGRFEAMVNGEKRHYRVPTYDEYDNLRMHSDFGIGVLYGDGATTTALSVAAAYGFEDFLNTGNDETNNTGVTRGMRGVIVFNKSNANQVFFPVGARGVGRRLIAGYTNSSYNNFGTLRYSSASILTGEGNSFRPIPYNMPANPGALYWLNAPKGSETSWDCNYFDMNFTPFSFVTGFTPSYNDSIAGPGVNLRNYNITHGGDALPIKLVRDRDND